MWLKPPPPPSTNLVRVLRLFQITDTATGKPVPELFFTNMLRARAKRTELNRLAASADYLRYVVSPGPDHKNYRGEPQEQADDPTRTHA